MAKKSKARKAKRSGAKKTTAKKTDVTPTYMSPGTSMTMGIHDVIRALKMIEKHKHLDKFARATKANDAVVEIGAQSVNFIKDFVVKNGMAADPVGRHIVNAARPGATAATAGLQTTAGSAPAGDRFRCNFGRRG
jgi:hypothetical protein